MLPYYCSPYNAEKRRFNEEQVLAAEAKDGQMLPMPPAYRDMELILFPEGSLKDSNGNVVSQRNLIGKSVGLYFADGDSPKCSSFLPFLLQFYRTVNEGGSHQKIEVIFVSADRDEKAYLDHVKHMPWLVVDYNDPLRTILLRHFRVEKESNIPSKSQGPSAGIPALVIVGADGMNAQFLQVCGGRDEGERALLRCFAAAIDGENTAKGSIGASVIGSLRISLLTDIWDKNAATAVTQDRRCLPSLRCNGSVRRSVAVVCALLSTKGEVESFQAFSSVLGFL
ncbi:PDI family protein [Cyclospora cayetanensis]|uniref:PDI family protein n=1 Tax=Cyclospora cayetanensis TaxID=88456 RepID=A0A1D3CWU6_9EIME|nr:PDI family protein [Cyclospora cayetanensis]